jgi:hypothetical protein
MTKNPIINALSASAYITLVVGVINFITRTLGSKPDSAIAPIVFLSLLTLSVSIMASVFFYQPLLLIIDGKKKEAISLIVQTVAVFGLITVVALLLLFSGII